MKIDDAYTDMAVTQLWDHYTPADDHDYSDVSAWSEQQRDEWVEWASAKAELAHA